jgi:hypothetical protein
VREFVTAVIVALGVLVSTSALAQGRGARDEAIVFAGLRPTSDSEMRETAIRRLAEAQGLRQVAENVVAAVSGREVVGHERLRELLGSSYLVELMACGAKIPCILKVVRPLRAKGYRQLVVGDYYVNGTEYVIRISLHELGSKAPPKTVTFGLSEATIEDPAAWQRHLELLFANRGKVEIISNVQGAGCTVDGKPCDLGPDRVISLPPGEHVIELSKQGYLPRSRVVVVQPGTQQTIALGLDALPIQAGQAPNQLTENMPAPGGSSIKVFGRVQFTAGYDGSNQGEGYEWVAQPGGSQPRDGQVSFFERKTLLGVAVSGPKLAGSWQTRGLFLGGPFWDRTFSVAIAQVDLVREDLGLKISFGRMFIPTVNTVAPGNFENTGFGSLEYVSTGGKVSKTLGPILVELGVGRPLAVPISMPPLYAPQTANKLPFVEGHVAYLDPGHSGVLYGQETPLTIGVSGAAGTQRVGPGEAATIRAQVPDAVDPVVEDLPVWIASAEAIIPMGRFMLVGEGYMGRGAGLYSGATFQAPRIDPMTGRHTQLASLGAWGQLSYAISERWVAFALGGIDRVTRGLDRGVAINLTPGIVQNRLLGAILAWSPLDELRFSVHLQHIRTVYHELNPGTLVSGMFDVQLSF